MTKALLGKVALVTGASRGIGAATARALAEQGAGAANSYADAASSTKADAIVSELERTGVRAAARVMGEGGRIISLGSWFAQCVGVPSLADYSATKAALAGYTRGWARDLGPRGIAVNVVQPGAIDTDMNPAEGPFATDPGPSIALGRYGRPEDMRLPSYSSPVRLHRMSRTRRSRSMGACWLSPCGQPATGIVRRTYDGHSWVLSCSVTPWRCRYAHSRAAGRSAACCPPASS